MNYFKLTTALILEVEGKHSKRYLQARLSNDINKLSGNCAILAAALTPQGKTEAYFCLFSVSSDKYLLICDGGEAEPIISAVSRYIVADQVSVKNISMSLGLLHLHNLNAAEMQLLTIPEISEDLALASDQNSYYIQRNRTKSVGLDIIASHDQIELLAKKLNELGAIETNLAQRELERIKAAIPSFPQELSSEYLFSESGLTKAVSFSKGCYTGQEVVAKIDSLGKTPHILKALEVTESQNIASGLPVMGSDNNGPKRVVGEIISSQRDPASGTTYCFASLKNIDRLSNFSLSVNELKAKLIS